MISLRSGETERFFIRLFLPGGEARDQGFRPSESQHPRPALLWPEPESQRSITSAEGHGGNGYVMGPIQRRAGLVDESSGPP
jgi:hypothetical protein